MKKGANFYIRQYSNYGGARGIIGIYFALYPVGEMAKRYDGLYCKDVGTYTLLENLKSSMFGTGDIDKWAKRYRLLTYDINKLKYVSGTDFVKRRFVTLIKPMTFVNGDSANSYQYIIEIEDSGLSVI